MPNIVLYRSILLKWLFHQALIWNIILQGTFRYCPISSTITWYFQALTNIVLDSPIFSIGALCGHFPIWAKTQQCQVWFRRKKKILSNHVLVVGTHIINWFYWTSAICYPLSVTCYMSLAFTCKNMFPFAHCCMSHNFYT